MKQNISQKQLKPLRWRIARRDKTTGEMRAGEYCYLLDEAEMTVKFLNRQCPDFEHWPEPKL